MDQKTLRQVGVKIGHFTDLRNATGTTVFLTEKGADIGMDIRGSSTGTFNTESYGNPTSARKLVHGIVLTGGSTYGLEACFGVLEYLEQNHIGAPYANKIVPGVTGAVLYDFGIGNEAKPEKKDGHHACVNASYDEITEGSIGAGTGATIGKWFKGKRMKGGFGTAETWINKNIVVTAFVVTNALGDAVNPATGSFYGDEGRYLLAFPENVVQRTTLFRTHPTNESHTTLAVIATNLSLNRPSLTKIAQMAHDGIARSIFPVHTSFDGDMTFAISSHNGERKNIDRPDSYLIDLVGIAASDALMKAIKQSIITADSLFNVPSYKDLYNK